MPKSARKQDHAASIEVTLEKMRRNEYNEGIQAQACLSLSQHGDKTIFPPGILAKAMGAVCKAMKRFPDHVNLQIVSLRFMAFQHNAKVAAGEGCIPIVLKAMRTHPGPLVLQTLGCRVVYQCASCEDSQILDELWREQALVTVLEALSGGLEEPSAAREDAQQNNLRITLQKLAYSTINAMLDGDVHESNNASTKPALTGLKVIPLCMSRHMQDAGLLCDAMDAMFASIYKNDQNTAILGIDGIKAVMEGMRAHESDVLLQRSGFRVLTSLTTHSQERESFADQLGCIEWVHRVMRAHQSQDKLQCLGSSFISCMVEHHDTDHGGEERRIKFAELGIIKTLAEALRSHKSDLSVSRRICEALAGFSIVKSARHKYLMLTQGACDAVLEAMATHNRDLIMVACGSFCCERTLAGFPDSCLQDILDFTKRARPIFHDIMSKNISCASLTLAFATLLKTMPASRDPESLHVEITLLIRCLKTHSEERVVIPLCDALTCSVTRSLQQDFCREAGAFEVLLALAERVKDNTRVVCWIRTVLTAITSNHQGNRVHLTRIMTPKQNKLLHKSGSELHYFFGAHSCPDDDSEALNETGVPRKGMTPLLRWIENDIQRDAVAQKFHDRAQEKQAEACTACGKTAGELGLARMLRCSACTLRPWYCSAECQRACWGAHKAECKANRVQKS
jgi:hypothetical protein